MPGAKEPGRLPLPPHHAEESARSWSYRPDPTQLLRSAASWRESHGLTPASDDEKSVHLLLVDLQKDFCFPEGSLFVAGRSGTGAIDDNDRIARLVYHNLGRITEITCTLDSHLPHQIFFASFWIDETGAPPPANREVSLDEVRSGRLRPDPALAGWLCDGDTAWLERQVAFYCAELEKEGKYTLFLWPPHCLLGSEGHGLAGAVQEARLFHAYARRARNGVELKGSHPLSENYSVLAPEVLGSHQGGRMLERNTGLIEKLLSCDALLVAGQAASHCVRSSLLDLLREIRERDERLARKVYVLRDCMSAVAIGNPARPGELLVDFTPQAEAALAELQAAGMHVVDSTTLTEHWLGAER